MALLELLQYPDPRLAQVCAPVDVITDEIKMLVANMADTMYEAPGVGLAAPQVGSFIRLFIMDATFKDEPPNLQVFINPQLELLGELVPSLQEGCLSVPHNYRADLKRYEAVKIRALNLEGQEFELELDDFAAVIVQHEYDHLDGKLFIDHISRLRRSLFDSKVKKCLKRQG